MNHNQNIAPQNQWQQNGNYPYQQPQQANQPNVQPPPNMQNPSQAEKPKKLVDEGVPETAWRKVHPISPLINTWSVIAAIFVIALWRNIDFLRELFSSGFSRSLGIGAIILSILGALILVAIIVGVYSWLSWKNTAFAVTDQAVWYKTGIIFKTQRHTRLERIQAVDIIHPLMGRIFGLGKISVEVAGAAGSSLSFGYLRTADLDNLRAEIMGRAAGVKMAQSQANTPSVAQPPANTYPGQSSGGINAQIPVQPGMPIQPIPAYQTGAPTMPGAGPANYSQQANSANFIPEAPEQILYRVPPGRLLLSALFSLWVAAGIVLLAAGVAIIVMLYVTGKMRDIWVIFAFAPLVFAVFPFVWGRFAGEFNFQAAVSPDGIRIRRGLLETRSQTIPPRRIHAVQISQPFLWRKLGWYRVTIDQAGYGAVDENGNTTNTSGDVLLPVGTWNDALLALWLVLPDMGVQDPAAFLEAAVNGAGGEQNFTVSPDSARLFDPLVRRRRGMSITGTCVVMRDGFLAHHTTFVPYARIQSLAVKQGPWQRRRRLAGLAVHTVPGPVVAFMPHLDDQLAGQLMEKITFEAGQQRQIEPPERWMVRIQNDLPNMTEPGKNNGR